MSANRRAGTGETGGETAKEQLIADTD